MLKCQAFRGAQGRRAKPFAGVTPSSSFATTTITSTTTTTTTTTTTATTTTKMGGGLCSPFSGECVQHRNIPSPPPPPAETNFGSISPRNTNGSVSCISDLASRGSTSSCPPHGAKAVCGRRSKMEDVYAIRENFVAAPDLCLTPILPSQLGSSHWQPLMMPFEKISRDAPDQFGCGDQLDPCAEPFHFFGVFDGHGGVEAANHCAERMYRNVQEAWGRKIDGATMVPAGGCANDARSEDAFVSSCGTCETNGSDACSWNSGRSSAATSEDVRGVFRDAFFKTDEEFNTEDVSALVGSTAVVALVGSRYLLLANCGDSRAVLCRGGNAHPLTVDHKPEREDEMTRVEKAGGQVWFWNGARVMGVLAMSRAIGDRSLRPYVIPDPEVTIVPRTADDSLLIMATDGLWDVVSDQEACTLAMKCLERARQKGATESEASRLTATVLIRAAMDRGSRDNITVVVVNLRTHENSATCPEYDTSSQISSLTQVSSAAMVDRQMGCQAGMDIEPQPIAPADEVVA